MIFPITEHVAKRDTRFFIWPAEPCDGGNSSRHSAAWREPAALQQSDLFYWPLDRLGIIFDHNYLLRRPEACVGDRACHYLPDLGASVSHYRLIEQIDLDWTEAELRPNLSDIWSTSISNPAGTIVVK